MKVLAYDWLFDEQFATQHKIKKSDLVTILKESDFVAIHLPLTAETKDLIDEKELKKMKKSAYLINTARGGIVNEEALYKALVGKVIAGAALDVFVNEPPKDFNLIRLPNVIATPHMAGYTFEAIENMGNMAANTALKVLAGEETIGKIV